MEKRSLIKLFCLLVSSLFFIACSHEIIPEQKNDETAHYQKQVDALEDFAIILSKAVAENGEMREFIREEALKQFDKDYDVFYPFVKNHVFSSGLSFQNVLSSYEEYENQLIDIEKAAPKLTIMVPDFSWIDSKCFSVREWNTTENQLCVGFDDRENEHRLYYKGELLGLLPASSFPSFPVLIVKSNERMSASVATKGGETYYSFADPAFDGRTDSKAAWGSVAEYWDNPTSGVDLFSQTGDFIPKSELSPISPSVISAYNEFKTGSTAGVQRDYVYYGMTKQNSTNGTLNPFMRDMLYRFRLTPEAIFLISDDITTERKSTEDPNVANPLNTGRGDRPDFTEAIPRLWGNGNYEIRIQFFHAFPSGSSAGCVGSIVLSISPNEIMYVDKCYRTFQWNVFGNNWSSYTITSSDIESKWYYPGDKNSPLPLIGKTWNLSKESDNMFMKVLEYDPSGTETLTDTRTYKKTDSVTISISGEDTKKTSLGINWGNEDSWAADYSYAKSVGSDELGDCEINYIDNYILTASTKNGKSGYQLKAIGNTYFSASFIPIDSRDEYQIHQFLLGRNSRNN